MSQGLLFALRGDQNSTDLEIDVFSTIGSDFWSYYSGGSPSSASGVRNLLKANQKAKNILVNINSRGGEVHDGLSIYEQLFAHPAHVKVRISALAASIASVIAMAGDEIEIPETGFVMVHGVSGSVGGNAERVGAFADFMRKANDTIATVYATRTGMALADVKALMTNGRDNYFTAAEAKKLGFVDTVVPAKPKVTAQAFAMLNMAGSDDAPPALLSAIERSKAEASSAPEEPTSEELSSLIARIEAKSRPENQTAEPSAPAPAPPAPVAASAQTQTQDPASGEATRPDEKKDKTMTIPKAITAALSLIDGADENSVLQAIIKLKSDVNVANTTASTATNALESVQSGLKKLEAITAKNGEEAIGVVTAWKTEAEKLPAVNAELKTLKTEKETSEIDVILNKGRDEKKLTKATADTYREQVNKKELSLTALTAIVATLTPIEHLANEVSTPVDDGKRESGNGSGAAGGPLSFKGKPYEDLSNHERSELANEDEDKFGSMRRDWEKRQCPGPTATATAASASAKK